MSFFDPKKRRYDIQKNNLVTTSSLLIHIKMVLIHIKRYQVCLACIIITINLIILHKSYVIFKSDHDVDLKISKKTRSAKIPQNKPPHFFTNPPTFDQIYNSSKSYPKNPDQIKVLIMAQWRGGSTLLSDVFRFNSKNSLYLYEPLRTVYRNSKIPLFFTFWAIF